MIRKRRGKKGDWKVVGGDVLWDEVQVVWGTYGGSEMLSRRVFQRSLTDGSINCPRPNEVAAHCLRASDYLCLCWTRPGSRLPSFQAVPTSWLMHNCAHQALLTPVAAAVPFSRSQEALAT